MCPQTVLDWVAFCLLVIGGLGWGYFVTDVNVFDVVLESIWDALDDMVFLLIGVSAMYAVIRAARSRSEES